VLLFALSLGFFRRSLEFQITVVVSPLLVKAAEEMLGGIGWMIQKLVLLEKEKGDCSFSFILV
jgi:hypothetical protein